ncbi:MAG: efflux RND transporter permease subunit [Deltaproteobacteria bacterium]|nr:efflux RND transporter permease subunit [Deltaproteobacteria bacterium]
MKFINFFIRRPITTFSLNVGILLIGLFAFEQSSIDLFPSITLPTLSVVISAPGLDVSTIEQKITVPVEERFNTIDGLKDLWSRSSANEAQFVLKFYWGESIDYAALKIRELMKNVELPLEAKSPQVFRWNPAEEPILRADISSRRPLVELTQLVEKKFLPKLERIEGVSKVDLSGTHHRQVLIKIDTDRLASYGLTFFHIAQALEKNNIQKQIGTFTEAKHELTLKLDGELKTLGAIEELPIVISPKKTLKLKDLAEIQLGYEKQKILSRISEETSIGIEILKSHEAATLDVISETKKHLSKLQNDFPEVKITYAKDDSIYIQTSRRILFGNFWQGAGLSLILVLLFLKSIASTIVIATTIPISIIGTFAFMKYFDVTQNVFSLAGITLACGMVVDSAIILLENIHRHHFEEGKSPWRAAVEGTAEVSAGVFTSVLTTLAIFIPIVICVKGLVGILFQDIAFTFVVALTLSLIVGFTLIPCLSYLLLKRRLNISKLTKPIRIPILEKGAKKVQDFYLSSVAYLLDRPRSAFFVISTLYAGSWIAICGLPGFDLIPLGEFNRFKIEAKAPQTTSLQETNAHTTHIEHKLKADPSVKTFATTVKDNTAKLFVDLKKPIPSLSKAQSYLTHQRDEHDQLADITLKILDHPKIDTSEGQGAPIVLVLQNADPNYREQAMIQLKQALQKVSDVVYIETNEAQTESIIQIQFLTDKLKEYGLTTSYLSELVYGSLEGLEATHLSNPATDEDWTIFIQDPKLNQASQQSIEALHQLPIITTLRGERYVLPLETFANIERKIQPLSIERTNHIPSDTLFAHLQTHRRSLQEIRSDIEQVIQTTTHFMKDITFESTLKVLNETFSQLFLALLFSIVLVYMILAAQFESFTQPISLILTLPLAAGGVLLGVTLWGFHLDVIVMLGIILLVGITVDAGILIIEYTNILRHRGMDRKEALLTALRSRMRPVFMTAITDVLGTLPMAFSSGAGAEMYQGFGVTTVFGITGATFLTLFSVPLTYSLLEDVEEYLHLKWLWFKAIHLKERTAL